jgi:hypothetical protein
MMTLALFVRPAYAQDDQNCANFESQAAAQEHLRADTSDPDNLDADNDGIACEDNPGPYDRVPVTTRPRATATPETSMPGATPGTDTGNKGEMPGKTPPTGGGGMSGHSSLPTGDVAAALALLLAGGYALRRRRA